VIYFYVKRKSVSRISVKRKKKRGRPATGQDPIIGLRLPQAEIASLDKWAKAQGYTRSEAIRVLIRSLKLAPGRERK
jgi:Ribbon-helix-helix protein, copG family